MYLAHCVILLLYDINLSFLLLDLETDARDQKVVHLADLEVAQEAALNHQRKIPDLDPVASRFYIFFFFVEYLKLTDRAFCLQVDNNHIYIFLDLPNANLAREVVPAPNQEVDRNHLPNNL